MRSPLSQEEVWWDSVGHGAGLDDPFWEYGPASPFEYDGIAGLDFDLEWLLENGGADAGCSAAAEEAPIAAPPRRAKRPSLKRCERPECGFRSFNAAKRCKICRFPFMKIPAGTSRSALAAGIEQLSCWLAASADSGSIFAPFSETDYAALPFLVGARKQ